MLNIRSRKNKKSIDPKLEEVSDNFRKVRIRKY